MSSMDRARQRKMVRTGAAALLATVTGALVISAASVYDKADMIDLLSVRGSYGAAEDIVNKPKQPSYTVKVGDIGKWEHPDDTPALGFFDKDGGYHLQQSDGAYKTKDPRWWSFYKGFDIDSAVLDRDVTYYKNPANPKDTNGDTTWRCNNSPTGKHSTYSNRPNTTYSQANYCDLIGLWVDPDSGDWYGLIHNEFSPQPHGDWLHFDAIDLAVSSDGGRTWDIRETIISSPFETERDNEEAFPESTYFWGTGDPRLIVDISSGYFYLGYGSRVVDKNGTWHAFHHHYARAPIADKMKAGSWKKWYQGKWEQPGLKGRESPIFPVDETNPDGYSHIDYDPKTPGFAEDQIKAGKLAPTTPLFWMDVGWNAHLGLWVGEPTHPDRANTKENHPQQFYATDDLTTQRWRLIGDTGENYKTRSAYRWMVDAKTATLGNVLGKTFRAYCSFYCSQSNSEFVNIAIDTDTPYEPVDKNAEYTVSSAAADVGILGKDKVKFTPTGDGAYTVETKEGILGIDETEQARAWAQQPRAFDKSEADKAGKQWWIIPSRSHEDNKETGTVRLVNRWSGLVYSGKDGLVPARSWEHGDLKPEAQELTLKKA